MRKVRLEECKKYSIVLVMTPESFYWAEYCAQMKRALAEIMEKEKAEHYEGPFYTPAQKQETTRSVNHYEQCVGHTQWRRVD